MIVEVTTPCLQTSRNNINKFKTMHVCEIKSASVAIHKNIKTRDKDARYSKRDVLICAYGIAGELENIRKRL